jgi:hypothetical protein
MLIPVPVLLINDPPARLPPTVYRAMPQRATFLAATAGVDAVIERVVRERRAAGLDPSQDMDFLGLMLASQTELGLTDRQVWDQVGRCRITIMKLSLTTLPD